MKTFNLIATALLVIAAVLVSLSAFRVAFLGPSGVDRSAPERLDEWNEAITLARPVVEPPDADDSLVVLMDLECPACAGFHEVVREVSDSLGNIHVAYIHHPLDYHPHAVEASRGALCAEAHGGTADWIEAVYAKQDSLGSRPWGLYAEDAGLDEVWTDLKECMNHDRKDEIIDQGWEFGEKIEATGVPTVLLNGWRFHQTPSKARLVEALERMSEGRRPR